jgi:hypothetical protein
VRASQSHGVLRALAQRWLVALALLLVLPGVPELLRGLSGVEQPCCPSEDCGDAHDDEGCNHLRSHCTCCPQAGALARSTLELVPTPRAQAAYAATSTLLRADGFGAPPLRPPA